MTNQIKTVLVADTILQVKNEVKPVTTSHTTSKMFKSHSDVYQHELDMFNATRQVNDKNNDYKIIDIKKLIKFNQNKITSFSWLLKINDNPAGLETFWTTYDKNFICGEHGF